MGHLWIFLQGFDKPAPEPGLLGHEGRGVPAAVLPHEGRMAAKGSAREARWRRVVAWVHVVTKGY